MAADFQAAGMEVSIHAPLAGRDQHTFTLEGADGVFQSTRPSRGATGNA